MTTNAITFNGSLTFQVPGLFPNAVGFTWNNLQFNNTTPITVSSASFLIGTGGTAINMGQVTNPRYAVFQNLDPTNYVQIYSSSGDSANALCRLLGASAGQGPFGDLWIGPLDPGAVPYGKANTAAVYIQYLIISA